MKLIFNFLIFTLLISSCSNKLKETPAENFIGLWKIEGRSMFDGIQIKKLRKMKMNSLEEFINSTTTKWSNFL